MYELTVYWYSIITKRIVSATYKILYDRIEVILDYWYDTCHTVTGFKFEKI